MPGELAGLAAQHVAPQVRGVDPERVGGLGRDDVPAALLDLPVELVTGSLAGMRIFAGYAGWGAEQLVAEIEEGSWYVVPGEAVDVFRLDPAELWRDVLRRQPGELAWHSTRPVDPELN